MDGVDTPPQAPKKKSGLKPPWKPGQSGNPAGRPKGARTILQEDFFKALQRDFAQNGVEVLQVMRAEKPNEYARMIAGLMSKEVTGEDGAPLFPASVDWNVRKPAD